ncbi:16S rRNA (uracil(1498)-N(3))-methyltransferase [Neomegalonema sp.]|uniref:16S rRNA (uracil(1498)-N(3))-methyltransferase n=1 Tax=Neomegalonema sp. TaxID=2039713 RepID=UPI0026183145|nr:16S rRNA (uracil(1498)-N(3))-methyltransferase [Neomegalonema sp.]MDD2868226.1 16S rRNA (uracil(1498)-N(3))-methyltransferase [Neomegalonema sp.]
MTDPTPKIRLHLAAPLEAGAEVRLAPEQAHYLMGVMRLGPGAEVAVFNNASGEWRGRLAPTAKRAASLEILARTRPAALPLDVDLLFAPIKKARTDFIVEKAAELGARRIRPVLTRFTNAERVNRERLQAHAVEAAEQCGGIYVPEVAEPETLARALEDWPAGRRLMFCDEARDAPPAHEALRGLPRGEPWAILIGPEGGFSAEERARLKAAESSLAVSLGPRILRADTAAAAALTIWQSVLGDWS